MTSKVVINGCYGGFSLSKEATEKIRKEYPNFDEHKLSRHDPLLIKVIEELGEDANGHFAILKFREISTDLIDYYRISEYDGIEELEIDWKRWFMDMLPKLTNDNVGEWKQKVQEMIQNN
jgi:hypothetical protein